MSKRFASRFVSIVTTFAVIGTGVTLLAAPAQANTAGTNVVINEVYGGGGNSGAPWTSDFIELYNPTASAISLDGWAVMGRSAGTTSGTGYGVTALSGSIPAGGYYLVKEADGTSVTNLPLPIPDASGSLGFGASSAQAFLLDTTTPVITSGNMVGVDHVIDMVGWGTGTVNAYETTKFGSATSNTTSVNRSGSHTDTDVNSADFAVAAPSPTNALGQTTYVDPDPGPDPEAPQVVTIAELQGTGTTAAKNGETVTTVGVVTGMWPWVSGDSRFSGFTIQTPGADATPGASDGLFVYVTGASGSNAAFTDLVLGDVVQVTGAVSEYQGLTELSLVAAADYVELDSSSPLYPAETAVVPFAGAWPTTTSVRESLESMLYQPEAGKWWVTDTYDLNYNGDVLLAYGDGPIWQPTELVAPTDASAYSAAVNANFARTVPLDDTQSITYFLSGSNRKTPLYMDESTGVVRVGAEVTFTEPVIVDQRSSTYKLQPRHNEIRAAGGGGYTAVSFENTRTAAPELSDAGDITIATFNVLNYFTTGGQEWLDSAQGQLFLSQNLNWTSCHWLSYNDKDGTPITTDGGAKGGSGCPNDDTDTAPWPGPRGAWDDTSLERQQAKIVEAINALDASVVGLLEIENSAKLGEARDEALATLVAALNDDAGSEKWAYVPSSLQLPPINLQDVITNAIIYQVAEVEPVGASKALGSESFGASGPYPAGAFANAREPIGQWFEPAGGGEKIFVVVNHFKSKGSVGPWPGDTDSGDGQGNANESRVRQATALLAWVDTITTADDSVALIGDFNAYTMEDPLQVLYAADYVDATTEFNAGDYSYNFDSMVGALDHVIVNADLAARVTDSDVWNINAEESVGIEYSRYNYAGEITFAADPYRSSDHNPVVVGVQAGTAVPDPTTDLLELDLLDINDYHGRIEENTTDLFAATIEILKEQNPDGTIFASAGDNLGASLFASALADDQPTIDVLNALDLAVSAVGNHEFDKGFTDLTDRIEVESDFAYLGANVFDDGDLSTPVMTPYELIPVTIDGVDITVGFVGVVTGETAALVSPGGIAGLVFGNPVDALNTYAADLTDGVSGNGEADVVIALVHDGAGAGTPEGATLQDEIDAGGAFAEIVTEADPAVDAIFTGHTHKQYAWLAPVYEAGVPTAATRPVIQTGSYGEYIGHATLYIDPETLDVELSEAENVARLGGDPQPFIDTYPAVAEVDAIVDAALAEAEVVGGQPVGEVTADITTAFSGANRDDRSSESALGNLVANALRDTLEDPLRGGAEIGVTNPGGLRSELFYAQASAEGNGVVTYAEANAVLPFANNLSTVTLTGTQLYTLLEQQWQTTADGVTRPTRPYLALGLSDNVSWIANTASGTASPGGHVLAIYVDGELVPQTDEWTVRVGTLSFLASGGDNFRVFTEGTDPKDSGIVDRDAWVAYLTDNSPLSPSFARSRAVMGSLPVGIANPGGEFGFSLNGLDLSSLGAPANSTATVTLGGIPTGDPYEVTGGSVTLSRVPVPDQPGDGQVTALVTVQPSGTQVRVPVNVAGVAPAIATTSLPEAVVGVPYDVDLGVTGNGAPTLDLAWGSLPFGLVFSDGAIVGTPVATGTSTITVRATNSTGIATQNYSLVVTREAGPVDQLPTRIAGDDRYETSAALVDVFDELYDPTVVFVATGENYPDALAAAAAAAHLEAPVILTKKSVLPAAVKAQLNEIQPDLIYVLGGSSTISGSVVSALRTVTGGPTVVRLAGDDRYETGRLIVKTSFGVDGDGDGAENVDLDTVVIATGRNFPDALSAGAAVASVGGAVVLVDGSKSSVPSATVTLLQDLDPAHVVIAGGTPSVKSSIENQLRSLFPGQVTRIAGDDRYETSIKVNQRFYTDADAVFFATGQNFPDALSAASLAGLLAAPLIVTEPTCISADGKAYVQSLTPEKLVLLGTSTTLSSSLYSLTTC